MPKSGGVCQSRLSGMRERPPICGEEISVGAVASGRQIETDGRSNNVVRSCLRSCAVFFALLFSAGAGVSQPTPLDPEQLKARVTVSGELQSRIVEVARNLKEHPQLKKLTHEEREDAVQ